MSVTVTLTSIVSSALAPFRSSTDGPQGADAVVEAVYEMGDMSSGVFDATLGEPTIEENEGLFTTDPKVVIPIENTKYGDAGTLVFDIPEGVDDEEAKFYRLLNVFDLGLDQLGQLEGEPVPVRYSGGNVIVMWDQLLSGPEADEWTEEEIEDVAGD